MNQDPVGPDQDGGAETHTVKRMSGLKVWLSVLVIGAMITLSFCYRERPPRVYRGAPITGQVIDTETKLPMADVVVVSEWTLMGGLHIDESGRLLIQETVTDAEGRYAFPAWGPLETTTGVIKSFAPRLHFFKEDYVFKSCENNRAMEAPLPDPLTSDCSGRVIELTRFHGTDEEYCEKYGGHSIIFLTGMHFDDCDWEYYPRMMSEFHKLDKRFSKVNKHCHLPTKTHVHPRSPCKSPFDVFREISP